MQGHAQAIDLRLELREALFERFWGFLVHGLASAASYTINPERPSVAVLTTTPEELRFILTSRFHIRAKMMTVALGIRSIAFALTAWLVCQAPSAYAQDTLDRAKALYLAASYEESLAVLGRLDPSSDAAATIAVAQYKAFCLLALDRGAEAKVAMEDIVKADAFYHPSDVEASPRVQGVFREVRRALLPGLVQRLYADARAALDRKDPSATVQFERVLRLLDDPDMAGPFVVDLRALATGFLDLSKARVSASSAPPVPPAGAAPTAATTNMARVASPTPPSNETSAAAHEGDPGVVPPVTVYQPFPVWAPSKAGDRGKLFVGKVEITIDEEGEVESVSLLQSVHPLYDAALLKAARTWRFKPATRGGFPVLYAKVVEVKLQPSR
jgi:TonB family protein